MQTDSPVMSPVREASSLQTDSPVMSPVRVNTSDLAMNTTDKSSRSWKIEPPTPKHVSPEELDVLQSTLRRWRTEVAANVKGNFYIKFI